MSKEVLVSCEGLGAGVELEVGMLDLHHAQLSLQVAWGALGKQLMVGVSIQHTPLQDPIIYC